MKWINSNKSSYFKRIIKSLDVIAIVCILLLILLSQNIPFLYSVIFITLFFLLPSSILWIKRAKYNIQTIEVIGKYIEIIYFEYNKGKKIRCDINNIKIELWTRNHGSFYCTVHVNKQLMLKQEGFFWKGEKKLKEVHTELKMILPYKTVLPAL